MGSDEDSADDVTHEELKEQQHRELLQQAEELQRRLQEEQQQDLEARDKELIEAELRLQLDMQDDYTERDRLMAAVGTAPEDQIERIEARLAALNRERDAWIEREAERLYWRRAEDERDLRDDADEA